MSLAEPILHYWVDNSGKQFAAALNASISEEDIESRLAALTKPSACQIVTGSQTDGYLTPGLLSSSNMIVTDLNAMKANLQSLLSQCPGSRMCVMVKANAYGAGAEPVATYLDSIDNVDFLGVATLSEAGALGRTGIAKEIIVTCPTLAEIDLLLQTPSTPMVNSLALLKGISDLAEKQKTQIAIHIELDTGFHRSGISQEQLGSALELVDSNPFIQLDGVGMHYACADDHEPRDHSKTQELRFNKMLDEFGLRDLLVHSCNSAAAIEQFSDTYDIIRPGLASYGISPFAQSTLANQLIPITKVTSKISHLVDVPETETVGYGATWTAPKDSVVAQVPFGYADGMRRSLSNNFRVKIDGNYFDVVGRVSMDSFTVDVTGSNVKPGDLVEVFSNINEAPNSITNAAVAAETIPYEIMTGLGARPTRVYEL